MLKQIQPFWLLLRRALPVYVADSQPAIAASQSGVYECLRLGCMYSIPYRNDDVDMLYQNVTSAAECRVCRRYDFVSKYFRINKLTTRRLKVTLVYLQVTNAPMLRFAE